EPKVSFVPLVFGTLKATLYAMLFAVPIAILGAIYTSEFMDPGARAVVKPTIEMMAGLPSVVLGFIGGLVLAPIFENIITGALLTFICVPAGVFMFGWLWQLLPAEFTRPLPKWVPFVVMIGAVLATFGVAMVVAPLLEMLLFGGDIKAWLNGRVGVGFWGSTAGWVALLTPLLLIAVVFIFNTFIRPRVAAYNTEDRRKIAVVDGVRLLLSLAVAILLAIGIGGLFTGVGLDLRGDWSFGLIDWSPAGTYITRNSVIIGIMMGFAVIPIIYTISEDALSSVPNTLRSAALGAGATPWQTAVRVVLPVGISGIFSACMIGLGRAVGETMIVLMAYGNTPILDGNIFNGGRTMAANIAVEMPEAPQGETLYRYLFLSALILFGMTFVINTVAEVVRNYFRKRATQL
ncbi:MAG: ABC transporter permease subunit, partial [Planctomycetota bacterium]